MKSKTNIRLASLLFVVSLLASFCASYAAGPAVTDAHVSVWRGDLWVDSVRAATPAPDGTGYELFSYQGTVYIPLRTAGAWMGKEAAWDQGSMTVTLSGTGERQVLPTEEMPPRPGTPEELAAQADRAENGIDIQVRPDITVLVDGQKKSFTNAKGEPVYPAIYNGATYLPVRSIGELLGMEVAFVPVPAGPDAKGDGNIYLRSPWKQGEDAAVSTFLDRSQAPMKALHDSILDFNHPSDTYGQQAQTAKSALKQLEGIAKPDSSFAAYRLERIDGLRKAAQEKVDTYLASPSDRTYSDAQSACQDLEMEYLQLVGCFTQEWEAPFTWLED